MVVPWFVAVASALPLIALVAVDAPGSAQPPAPACADPAIIAAVAHAAGTDPAGVRTYAITVTVANLGSAAQPDTLLQSVVITQDRNKVGEQGLQPLKPGQRETTTYRFVRSAQAALHSTQLTFRLALTDPHGHPISDCNPGNDTYHLSV